MKKKIICLCIFITMLFSFIYVKAVDETEKIITTSNLAEELYKIAKPYGMKTEDKLKIENYLKDNVVTDEQANSVIKKVEEAIEIIENSDVQSIKELSNENKTALISKLKEAAEVVDLKLKIQDNGVVVVTDKDEKIIETIKVKPNDVLELTVEQKPNKVGEEFEVLLNIPPLFKIKAGDFKIKYPVEKLEFVNSKLNSNFYSVSKPVEGSEWGYISCSILDMNIKDENVDLSLGGISFKFKVLQSGTSTISTEIESLYKLDETVVEVEDCMLNVYIPFEDIDVSFEIIDNNQIITGIEENTNISTFLSRENVSSEYRILVNDKELDKNVEDIILTTGTNIKVLKNNEVINEYIIVIYGDTNGSGTIDAVDALTVVKNKLELEKFLDKVYEEAGRVTIPTRQKGDVPSAVDALAIVKHKLDLEKIQQKINVDNSENN